MFKQMPLEEEIEIAEKGYLFPTPIISVSRPCTNSEHQIYYIKSNIMNIDRAIKTFSVLVTSVRELLELKAIWLSQNYRNDEPAHYVLLDMFLRDARTWAFNGGFCRLQITSYLPHFTDLATKNLYRLKSRGSDLPTTAIIDIRRNKTV